MMQTERENAKMGTDSNAVAIITARGGSKRIPGKNSRMFLGKPMLVYSVEAALQAGIFREVMVSTDDEKIAQIAREAGASVPFMRSEKTADDFATTDDVLMEVLKTYEERGEVFDYMACIYPTAPFVTAQKLREAMRLLIERDGSGVMPVVRYSFPPQRGMAVRDGKLVYCYPENAAKRSQDLEPIYHDSGQFYCYHVKRYLACKGDLPDGYLPMIMSETQVQDIDNPADWELAEIKYKRMLEQGGNQI